MRGKISAESGTYINQFYSFTLCSVDIWFCFRIGFQGVYDVNNKYYYTCENHLKQETLKQFSSFLLVVTVVRTGVGENHSAEYKRKEALYQVVQQCEHCRRLVASVLPSRVYRNIFEHKF